MISKSPSSSHPSRGSQISKEEELKRALAAEREKRAAAAERRMAAAAALSAQGNLSTTPQPKTGEAGEGADGGCGYGPSDANGGGTRDGGGGGGRVSGKLVMIIVVVTTMALKWWQWRRRRQ